MTLWRMAIDGRQSYLRGTAALGSSSGLAMHEAARNFIVALHATIQQVGMEC